MNKTDFPFDDFKLKKPIIHMKNIRKNYYIGKYCYNFMLSTF